MTSKETPGNYYLQPIGTVASPLKTLDDCPLQEHEGAPEAWLEIFPGYRDGLEGLVPGSDVILLTWFHQAERNLLKQYRRRESNTPPVGVFTLRSPHRPNPIGLHHVRISAIGADGRIRVAALEALDGTPILDIKPVI